MSLIIIEDHNVVSSKAMQRMNVVYSTKGKERTASNRIITNAVVSCAANGKAT
jgi:hypothetical protein